MKEESQSRSDEVAIPDNLPHRPAAFINAIAEEGTKAEAVEYLQKEWNENGWLIERVRDLQKQLAAIRSEQRDSARLDWVIENGLGHVQNTASKLKSDDWRKRHPNGGPGYGVDKLKPFFRQAIDLLRGAASNER